MESKDILRVKIDSFESGLNLTYKLEGLPLDYLKIDNILVSSQDCSKTTSPLRCLKAGPLQYPIERCLDTFTIDLTYGFNEFLPFSHDSKYESNHFEQHFSLECK